MSDYRKRLNATMREGRNDWYRINNTAGTASAEVYLFDEIGFWGTSAQTFVDEVKALDVDTIELHVNSPGGDVWDGIAILNTLRAHKARVVTTVDGVAASAASFIAMAGDEIVMARNSELMIHDAWGFSIGNAEDMTKMAADLDRMSDNIASIYAERAGGTTKQWRDTMRTEVWYSAQEAVDAGLADRVIAKKSDDKTKAHFDLSVFNYAGRTAAPAPTTPAEASAHGSPAASAAGRSTAVEFTPEQDTAMLEALSLPADTTDAQTVVDAVVALADDEATEPPDPTTTNAEPSVAAAMARLPQGMQVVETATIEALKADASAGRAAREQQLADHRTRLVDTAVRDGRIAPARREHWENSLKADDGNTEVLAGLAKGLIPVDGEIGHGKEIPADDEKTAVASIRESDAYKNWSM